MKDIILLVEDDVDINNLLYELLSPFYQVNQAFSGSEGQLLLQQNKYDLVILDLMLPGLSGEQLLLQTKQSMPSQKMLVITAKAEIDTLVSVFDLGADDYIAKPFKTQEVLARVKVLLRKKEEVSVKTWLTYGDLMLNTETYQVKINSQDVVITGKEFELLKAFLSSPNRVFTKANLYELVWKEAYMGDDNTINVHISRLRSKLQNYLGYEVIETVWGVGFKLKS